MTDQKYNASSGARGNVLKVEVKDGDKSALTDRDRSAGVERASGGVTSTFWAFADFKTNGRFFVEFTFGGGVTVNAFSQVAASITELDSPDRNPFLGDADMVVYNVVPSRQKVLVAGNIQWGRPLDFRVNLIIAN